MRHLKILFSESAIGLGGQERYILRLMRILREHGHTVELLCQPQAQLVRIAKLEGFTVHTQPMGGLRNLLQGIYAIRRLLKHGQYNIVNSNSRTDTLITAAAARLAHIPVIVRTRHLALKVNSLLSYNVLPNRVITPSQFVRQHLIDKGMDADAIAVVYPSIDPKVLDEAPTHDLRAELGVRKESILVGCVAVLRLPKGHNELIDAIAPLCLKNPDIHLVIVGGGDTVFPLLQEKIKTLQLESQIHLLGARNDVPSLLPNFDIFALPSHSEASGTAFVEAGALGLPVIGTRVGGLPEMMEEGKTGLLTTLFDISALQKALQFFIDHPEQRKKFGQAGHSFCRDNTKFTPEAMGTRTENAYLQWLNELEKQNA